MSDEETMPTKKKTDDAEVDTPQSETIPSAVEETPEATPVEAPEPAMPQSGAPRGKRSRTPAPEPEPIPAHPSLVPPTQTFPVGRLTMVEDHHTLRKIGQVLSNGARAASNPYANFNVHSGLVIQMQRAFEARETDPTAPETFFQALTTYLQQASGHIMGALHASEVEPSVQQARALIEQVNATGRSDGFEQVARYLLLLAHPIIP